MKIVVICQLCHRKGTVNTRERSGWVCEKVCDLLTTLSPQLDWDIWVCPGCWRETEELREFREDKWTRMWEEVLQITQREKANAESL